LSLMTTIPQSGSLADELIQERRLEAKKLSKGITSDDIGCIGIAGLFTTRTRLQTGVAGFASSFHNHCELVRGCTKVTRKINQW